MNIAVRLSREGQPTAQHGAKYLKEQKERMMFGTISAQKLR